MTAPGLGNSQKVGEAYIRLSIRDETQAAIAKQGTDMNRRLQSTAQIARNSVAGVMRGLGTSVTATVFEPILDITEGLSRLGIQADETGDKVLNNARNIGLGLTLVGASLALLGGREKQATDMLANAIDNAGGSIADFSEEIESTIKQQEKYGRTAIQVKFALTTLTQATHDPAKAIEMMGEVSDLAAARHTNLANASRQVAIAIGGGGRLFRQYNIDIIRNADGTRNYAAMNEELAKVISGTADAAVQNFGGHLKQLGSIIENDAAVTGQKYGVAIASIGAALTVLSIVAQGKALKSIRAMMALQIEAIEIDKQREFVLGQMAIAETNSAAIGMGAADARVVAAEKEAAANEALVASYAKANAARAEAAGAGIAGAGAAAAGAGAVAGAGAGAAATTESGVIVAANERAAASAATSSVVITEAAVKEAGSYEAAAAAIAAANASIALDTAITAASVAKSVAEEATAFAVAKGEELKATSAFAEAQYAAALAARNSAVIIAQSAAREAAATDIAVADMIAAQKALQVSNAATGRSFLSFLGGKFGAAALVAVGVATIYGAVKELDDKAKQAKATDHGMLERTKKDFDEFSKSTDKSNDAMVHWLLTSKSLGPTTAAMKEQLGSAKDLGLTEQQLSAGLLSGDNAWKKFLVNLEHSANLTKTQIGILNDLHAAFGVQTQDTTAAGDAELRLQQHLGLSDIAYKSVIDSMDQKAGADTTAQNAIEAFIPLNAQLMLDLGKTADVWEKLVNPVIAAQHAYVEFNRVALDVTHLEEHFKPALDAMKTWEDAKQAVVDGQQAITDAQTQGAENIAAALQSVNRANQDVTDTQLNGLQSIKSAQTAVARAYESGASSIASAEKAVTTAQTSALDAQTKLNAARKTAAENIKEAIKSLRDLAENEQKARDALAKAQMDQRAKAIEDAQNKLNSTTGNTLAEDIAAQAAIDAQRAQLVQDQSNLDKNAKDFSVVDAKHALEDTIAANKKAREEAAATVKAGINGDKDVIASKKDLHNALHDEREAVIAVAKAKHDAKVAEQSALDALTKARRDAARANDNAIAAQVTAQQNYQKAQRDTNKSVDTAKGKMHDLTDAVDADRTALDIEEGKIGATDQSLHRISATIKNMNKKVDLLFQAEGEKNSGQALVNIKRSIEETILEAGGMSVAAARAKARADNPNYGVHNAPGSGKATGTKTGRTKAVATGGAIHGEGTGTSDSIPAWLSNNEHVWTAAEVQAAGGHGAVEAMRRSVLGKFKAGGPVIDINKMKIPERLKDTGLLSLLGFKETDKFGGNLGSGGGGWGNMGAVQSFLRSVDPLPYIFGAVGPGAYDCSGLVGEVWARLTGHPSFKRYFSTSNEASFFEPGPGIFTVGILDEGGGNGHTVGKLGGMKFEARGTEDGILIGNAAKDALTMPVVMHLKEPPGSKTGIGSTLGIGDTGAKGGHLSPAAARGAGRSMMPRGWNFGDLDRVFTGESGWRWNALNAGSGAYGIPQSLPGNKMASAGRDWHENAITQLKWGLGYIRDRYGNPTVAEAHERAFNWYDKGGMLPTGASLTMNKTGKPERVLNEDQWNKLTNKPSMHIEKVVFNVEMSKVNEVSKLLEIIHGIPRAVLAGKGSGY